MVKKNESFKPKQESKKERKRWSSWGLIGALVAVSLAVVVAVTVSPMTASKIGSLINSNNKSCQCPSSQDSGKYKGVIEGCCCDYESVDSVNGEVLHPLLQELVTTPFFRYFKVKLWCDCPFWPDDGMCRLRDCSVCECPENEFPEPLKKPFLHGLPADDVACQEGKPQAAVDRTLDSRAFKGWIETDNPWTNDDETDNDEMTYVNLLLNPERYTGYVGPSARRIWDAVYSENCLKSPLGEMCQEKMVLYKLISGLHSSISTHIAADYLLDESTNKWGQNPELMYDRVLRYPDRVRNLYFTFLFVLRAVTKVSTVICVW
ncbi:endoplasmic reticulum oxidoreductin-1-like [Populus alba x Populus x berolinensis]|uniref:Endoplasmic reticulum oxidoreductin-1-like n=1 Tax=Populus alba x Populus x berolinensis TaxID=444605 RepID=A0AAD6Q7R1_9ROSI|nr:endoplasmic reticulum oxidoreductin-1-like [Populus alba x Populus x berolinensis]